LTFSSPGLKAVSSNASLGLTVRFLGGDDRRFSEGGSEYLSNDTNLASYRGFITKKITFLLIFCVFSRGLAKISHKKYIIENF
jgi:hypothetical protein